MKKKINTSQSRPIIQKATLSDINALDQLEQVCFSSDRLQRPQIKFLIMAKHATIYLAILDKQTAASAIILSHHRLKLARLYSFAVHPKFQSQGIGSFLLEFVELQLKNSAKELRLEVSKVNKKAFNFYKKNGYRIFARFKKFFEDGNDDWRLNKYLP